MRTFHSSNLHSFASTIFKVDVSLGQIIYLKFGYKNSFEEREGERERERERESERNNILTSFQFSAFTH